MQKYHGHCLEELIPIRHDGLNEKRPLFVVCLNIPVGGAVWGHSRTLEHRLAERSMPVQWPSVVDSFDPLTVGTLLPTDNQTYALSAS